MIRACRFTNNVEARISVWTDHVWVEGAKLAWPKEGEGARTVIVHCPIETLCVMSNYYRCLGTSKREETYMVSDIGRLDEFVHLIEILIGRVQAGQIVQHKAFELFFSARGVAIDERTNTSGVLCPLENISAGVIWITGWVYLQYRCRARWRSSPDRRGCCRMDKRLEKPGK